MTSTLRNLLARLDLARHRWAEKHLDRGGAWAQITGCDDD